MDEETIRQIEDYLDGNGPDIPLSLRDQSGFTEDYAAGRNRYIGYLISLATRSYKGMRVGLDCANGSVWMIAKSVFDALGAKTYVIHDEPNGLNINENCGSTHIESLQQLVLQEHLDVGFAFDGDADRCMAVDENGHVVNGDGILYIYGKYLKERGKLLNNTVVTTVMSNLGLYKAFDREGISYEKTKVGDKYVYECMQQHGYRLGGEESGHIIFSKYATTGDGLLTAIKIMEVILERKTSLSRLVAPLEIYPQVLRNVPVMDKEAVMKDPDVLSAVQEVADSLGTEGRILVRPSGTELLVRIMVEARSPQICNDQIQRVYSVIENKGYIVKP